MGRRRRGCCFREAGQELSVVSPRAAEPMELRSSWKSFVEHFANLFRALEIGEVAAFLQRDGAGLRNGSSDVLGARFGDDHGHSRPISRLVQLSGAAVQGPLRGASEAAEEAGGSAGEVGCEERLVRWDHRCTRRRFLSPLDIPFVAQPYRREPKPGE